MSTDYDVVFKGSDMSGVSMEVVACLDSKGFCVIDPGLPEEDFTKAMSEIEAEDGLGKLARPSDMIVEGLLGAEGSARIMELEIPDAEPSADATGLRKLDDAMTETTRVMDQYLEAALGFTCPVRTPGLVHETGMVTDEPPELGLEEASTWMTTFMRHKLMMVFCLGPIKGTLELRPFDEDAEVFEVTTTPGSLIILRADAMTHRHFAHSKALLLTTYLMEYKPLTKHSIAVQENSMVPVAQELQSWTVTKMKEIKEREYEYNEIADVPAGWSTAMNVLFHCVQRVAVRGMAGRYASTFHQPTFFRAQTTGVDYAIEIPLARWNVHEYYDSDPECWRWNKVYLKHGSFMDGGELFDCRFFGLSVSEASGMDVHQREVLEVGYDACWAAGYKKGKMMNALGGVYLGSSMTIFGSVSQVSGATGGAASINSNRFSFCLGLKGPSMTIDTESSSSLSAVYCGCEGVLDKGRGTINAFSLSGGVAFQLGTIWWPQLQSAGLLNPQGRCMTFDASADGYMMGDGCGFVVLKRLTETVEGEQVFIEDNNGPPNGVIAASTMNSNGVNSAMNAPNGPSEQELVAEAVRHAGLVGANVDAVEVNGQGAFMADAVEVDSLMRVLRGGDSEEPLGLGAVKSRNGHAHECAGVMSLQKAIMANAWNVQVPNCHLQQLNPHMEPENKALYLSENVEYARTQSYTGVTSRGFGGTNVHVMTFGECDPSRLLPLPDPEVSRDCIQFWPGGGGELEESSEPRRGYFIAGTWNYWTPQPMESEGGSSFGFTVTLGEARWEEFQIYLDGDATKALHPKTTKAYKGASVNGPTYGVRGMNWRIAGTAGAPPEQAAIADKADGTLAVAETSLKVVSLGAGDAGLAGDQYRVHLKVVGKYRTVTWEKVGHTDAVPTGEYYVTSNWNGWTFDKMTKEGDVYTLEALLLRAGAEFQIARNADEAQIIYPAEPRSDAARPGYGPDDGVAARGLTWQIGGQIGDVYKITLSLNSDDLEARVSWTKLREEEPLTEEQASISKRPMFGVVGSWGGYVRQAKLTFGGVLAAESPMGLGLSTTTVHYFYVLIGPDGAESFQLLRDLDWDQVIHPNRPVDTSGSPHVVMCSPNDGYAAGLVWTVGPADGANPGDVYIVRIVAQRDRVANIKWEKAVPSPELDAAIANGTLQKYK